MTQTATKRTKIAKNYRPSEDEKFMGAKQKEYFRQKLEQWKQDLADQIQGTMNYLKDESVSHPDLGDAASANADRQLELRTKDRLGKLVSKIDQALGRIKDGSYGYCLETGDPIRLARLEARPIAVLSIEAQEMHEQGERKGR